MEGIKLNDNVFEQIKDFKHNRLTKYQKLLIDKLILNEELKERYKNYGICKECKQINTGHDIIYNSYWCNLCNSKRFQQNFKNWTSGNHDIDEFIQNSQLRAKSRKEILEWIEYDRFVNIEYLAKGGYGTMYKAIWKDGYIESWDSENNRWNRLYKNMNVALKCLHDSQDITVEFLREIESYLITNKSMYVVSCYGITKYPETNDFMIVMKYIDNGSLRQYLNNNFNSLNWSKKLSTLRKIAHGLYNIHNKGLIHHDFHCGNILNDLYGNTYITDLGLCKPANAKPSQIDNKEIHGVLPYVAPEVLRGKDYTQASDIYGFGIIAYEVCTGLPPYYDMAHEEFLAIEICQGLRPKSNYKIPQLILDIIKKCWDADPLKRPKIRQIYDLFDDLYMKSDKINQYYFHENSLINKQIKEADEINKQSLTTTSSLFTDVFSYTTHPQSVYTSRLLDFKNLSEPKNPVTEYSEYIAIDFTKLKRPNSEDESSEKVKKIKLDES